MTVYAVAESVPELKPCPFCGNFAVQGEWWPHWDTREHRVYCYDGCGAEISLKTREDAIAAWNARIEEPTPTVSQETAVVEELAAALQWYAETFCELGPYTEACGKLGDDQCSGCRARTALSQAKGQN